MSPSASYIWKEISKRIDLLPISSALEQDLWAITEGAKADILKIGQATKLALVGDGTQDIADIYYDGIDCNVCGVHVSGPHMFSLHGEYVCKHCYNKSGDISVWDESLLPVRRPLSTEYQNAQSSKCNHCGQYGKYQSACDYCGAPID